MPQISHIHYHDILQAHRLDADFFKTEYLMISQLLQRFGSQKLSHIIGDKNVFSGPFGSTLKSESYVLEGIPFIRISDIQDIFIEKQNLVYISEEESKRLKSTSLGVDDIVLSKIGTIGRLSLITSDIGKVNISENNVGLRLSSLKVAEKRFLLFFLISRYGQAQMIRAGSGNVQLKFNVKDIDNLLIPSLDKFDLSKFEKIYDKIIETKNRSKSLYNEAEQLLLAELGLLDHAIAHHLTFTTTRSAVQHATRYDAEYFQPKYDEIIKKIKLYTGGWDYAKNVIDFKDKNFTPQEDKEYRYIALSNVSSQGYIQDYQQELGKNLPSRARRKIHTNDLIISSIEGSLSSCALVDEIFDNAVCSTGFFVINSDIINSETLLILFKSYIIQELLQRGSKGTILTAISKSEIESIKIPLIVPHIQSQIAQKIQESHKLRLESKQLLEDAKRMVEEEIEKI